MTPTNWDMISAADTVIVHAFWKGSGLPIVLDGRDVRPFVQRCHLGIVQGLREGETIASMIALMKGQMDRLEGELARTQEQTGLENARDLMLAAWKDDETILQNKALWLTNVINLLKLKAIEDDERFGIMLQFISKSASVQYMGLPPLTA